MKLHGNAALTPNGRLRLVRRVVEEGWSLTEAAEAAEVSERTARKWVDRYRDEGEAGLVDRTSAPCSQPGATPQDRIEAIAALRRLRMTGAEIAEMLSMALSTVQGILTRVGLGKLSRLEPPEPPNRYERKRAGELIHIDVKKLRRIGERGAGHRATGNRSRGSARAAPAGSSSTSASTTPPASPMSSCCPTRRRPPASASSSGRCASTPPMGSRPSD